MQSVAAQLETLKEVAENGVLIPSEILDLMRISYNNEKAAVAAKPVSESDERRQLEKGLENYTCTLTKELSTQARNLGLEKGKTVCSLVSIAVSEYIKRKRQSEKNEVAKKEKKK